MMLLSVTGNEAIISEGKNVVICDRHHFSCRTRRFYSLYEVFSIIKIVLKWVRISGIICFLRKLRGR